MLNSCEVPGLTHATVSIVEFDGGRAASLFAVSTNGRPYRFNAKTFVLAGGTIGSNRLMLSLQRDGSVPWKDNSNVGAYFHDHLGDGWLGSR